MTRKRRSMGGRRDGRSEVSAGQGNEETDRRLEEAAAHLKARRFDHVVALCERVLSHRSGQPRACHLLAVVCLFRGDPASAIQWLDRAIAGAPNRPAYYADRGMALAALNRHQEAVASFRRVLAINPDLAPVQFKLARSLRLIGHNREAKDALMRGLDLSPTAPEAWRELGEVCIALQRFDDAVNALQRAVQLNPSDAHCHFILGIGLINQNRTDDAISCFDRAITLHPAHHAARRARAFAHLQIVYRNEDEIRERRALYRQSLDDLVKHYSMVGVADLAASSGSIVAIQPYYLPYQGHNDRELQALLGGLTSRMMTAALGCWRAEANRPAVAVHTSGRGHDRIRVGLISGYFQNHSVWKIPLRGWLTQLDRRQFEVFAYHTQSARDACTAQAASACERFVQGPKSLAEWCAIIEGDRPDVLIFPEIGMDPTTAALAALRLAKVQCNSLGHPVTSGYPTIDYSLSSALMEPPGAQQHYTERLIPLPHIGCYYEPLDVEEGTVRREDLGGTVRSILFWSCQNLAKYLPRYDDVFPRIAQEVGDCRFVFIRNPSDVVTDAFRARMQRAFAAHGLDCDRHCVFVRRMDTRTFAATAAACDVFLDSLGWSGFNTTMESLRVGLPVVTCPGAMMRTRHTAAVLTMIGATETIAETPDDFVAQAIRIGTDRTWREENAARIASRREMAYRDRACVSALERFLVEAVVTSEHARDPNEMARGRQ